MPFNSDAFLMAESFFTTRPPSVRADPVGRNDVLVLALERSDSKMHGVYDRRNDLPEIQFAGEYSHGDLLARFLINQLGIDTVLFIFALDLRVNNRQGAMGWRKNSYFRSLLSGSKKTGSPFRTAPRRRVLRQRLFSKNLLLVILPLFSDILPTPFFSGC